MLGNFAAKATNSGLERGCACVMTMFGNLGSGLGDIRLVGACTHVAQRALQQEKRQLVAAN